jgi:hypothetical protein
MSVSKESGGPKDWFVSVANQPQPGEGESDSDQAVKPGEQQGRKRENQIDEGEAAAAIAP